MSDHDELIAQFIEISGGDENVARFYLSSSNWSLEDALSNFLGNQSENDAPSEDVAPSVAASQGQEAAGSFRMGGGGGGANNADSFGKKSDKPKFATLNDMTRRSSNEEDGQAFYAGGSERSGQQVLGPPKRKDFREQLTDMFRMAQEQGSQEATPAPSTSGGITWGQGMRLGMTNTDHTAVGEGGKNKAGEKKPIVVLKLWSKGFSIDDGELRLYDDPENKEFLETVMRGEIPQELLQMGWMVNVDVEDHRHEEYKKAAPTQTFRGSGHTLGSPAPTFAGAPGPSIATTAAPNANIVEDEKLAKEKLKLNTAEPTTTIQIRLADGSRLAAQFNLSHTVADIQQYIQNARPQYANTTFRLVSSFPTRELTDDSATIDIAGLKNAAIMQRMV